jgi:N-acetylglutamate synthase-like GNAT family acetyltransferase
MNIELAQLADIKVINRVIESAKRYWGYSDELMSIWLPDLLLKPEDFKLRNVWVLKKENEIVAISSLFFLSDGLYELEDFWVSPAFMGAGIGRKMFQFIINHLEDIEADKLVIISDPNAETFYNKMGAIKVDLFASKPEGRMLPIMELLIG